MATKFYRTRIVLDVISMGKLKPHDLAQIQSPGPVDYLAEYDPEAGLDPFVAEMKFAKPEVLDKKELVQELGLSEEEAEEAVKHGVLPG